MCPGAGRLVRSGSVNPRELARSLSRAFLQRQHRHRRSTPRDRRAFPHGGGTPGLLGGIDRADFGAILREDVAHDVSHVGRVVHDQHSNVIETGGLIEPHCGTLHVSPPYVPIEVGLYRRRHAKSDQKCSPGDWSKLLTRQGAWKVVLRPRGWRPGRLHGGSREATPARPKGFHRCAAAPDFSTRHRVEASSWAAVMKMIGIFIPSADKRRLRRLRSSPARPWPAGRFRPYERIAVEPRSSKGGRSCGKTGSATASRALLLGHWIARADTPSRPAPRGPPTPQPAKLDESQKDELPGPDQNSALLSRRTRRAPRTSRPWPRTSSRGSPRESVIFRTRADR